MSLRARKEEYSRSYNRRYERRSYDTIDYQPVAMAVPRSAEEMSASDDVDRTSSSSWHQLFGEQGSHSFDHGKCKGDTSHFAVRERTSALPYQSNGELEPFDNLPVDH
jgi:hypothetical protein